MNIILNANQSDTKKGAITLPANANLTGYDNSLVKIVNNAGAANFALPTAVTDFAFYVLATGDAQGNLVAGEVPAMDENVRLLFSGNCNPGDALALNGAAYGQIFKPAAGAGNIACDWIAEEAGAGGTTLVPQLLKCRRIPRITVNF